MCTEKLEPSSSRRDMEPCVLSVSSQQTSKDTNRSSEMQNNDTSAGIAGHAEVESGNDEPYASPKTGVSLISAGSLNASQRSPADRDESKYTPDDTSRHLLSASASTSLVDGEDGMDVRAQTVVRIPSVQNNRDLSTTDLDVSVVSNRVLHEKSKISASYVEGAREYSSQGTGKVPTPLTLSFRTRTACSSMVGQRALKGSEPRNASRISKSLTESYCEQLRKRLSLTREQHNPHLLEGETIHDRIDAVLNPDRHMRRRRYVTEEEKAKYDYDHIRIMSGLELVSADNCHLSETGATLAEVQNMARRMEYGSIEPVQCITGIPCPLSLSAYQTFQQVTSHKTAKPSNSMRHTRAGAKAHATKQ